jgi:hypothetical protein
MDMPSGPTGPIGGIEPSLGAVVLLVGVVCAVVLLVGVMCAVLLLVGVVGVGCGRDGTQIDGTGGCIANCDWFPLRLRSVLDAPYKNFWIFQP